MTYSLTYLLLHLHCLYNKFIYTHKPNKLNSISEARAQLNKLYT